MLNNGPGSVQQKYHVTNFHCLRVVTRIWAGLYSVQIPAGARDFSVLRNVETGYGMRLGLYSLETVSLGVQ